MLTVCAKSWQSVSIQHCLCLPHMPMSAAAPACSPRMLDAFSHPSFLQQNAATVDNRTVIEVSQPVRTGSDMVEWVLNYRGDTLNAAAGTGPALFCVLASALRHASLQALLTLPAFASLWRLRQCQKRAPAVSHGPGGFSIATIVPGPLQVTAVTAPRSGV